jgi:uroporphyrinogen-III synthase
MSHSGALPLRHLLVTRPQPQADEWVERLRGLGQPACATPLMVIEPVAAFAAAVQAAWHRLADCRMVMFVSPNAVLQFFAQRPAGLPWPTGTLAAATGPGTVAALQSQGVTAVDIVAPDADAAQFDAETLWLQRLESQAWSGRQVLIVRGEDGRDWLASTLRHHGAQVELLAAYRRTAPAWSGALLERLEQVRQQPVNHAWLFSSSQAIEHLAAFIRTDGPTWGVLQDVPALATHLRIAQTARSLGWRTVLPLAPDAALIAAAMRTLG